jgi:outer membrane protein assembly factor BamB
MKPDTSMRTKKRSRTQLLLVFALLLCGAAQGEDWPQFRGIHRDGCSPETGLLKTWPEAGLTPLWLATGLGQGFSSAVIAKERIYLTGMPEDKNEGALFCFDLNGKQLWRQVYGPEYTDTFPGPRGTPTFHESRLYLMSGLGKVFCLEAATGAVLWSRDAAGEFHGAALKRGFNESLLVDGNRVICTPGGPDAVLVALDTATGHTVWTTPGFTESSAYCSPILVERGGTRLLITLTAKSLVALNPKTGATYWRLPFDVDEVDQNHAIMPVYQDGCIYVTSGHRKGGQMYALSPDGREAAMQWSDTTLNPGHGGVVLVDGYIYGSNAKGDWACLALKDGAVKYAVDGVGSSGSLVYADGMLYCYGEKGTIGLVKASPGGFEITGRFKVTQGSAQHWPHPVLADGRLYIRHGDALLAYDVRAKSVTK